MEILSPKTDFCAKELFSHELILWYFISDVTGMPPEKIRSVRLDDWIRFFNACRDENLDMIQTNAV